MRSVKTIQHEIEDTIIHSQDYPFKVNASEIVEQWRRNKDYLIKMFGGETTIMLNDPVSINLDENEKEIYFEKFLKGLEDVGVLEYTCLKDPSLSLETFLRENLAEFFENRLVKNYPCLKIGKGSKLSKSFKYFIKDTDECRIVQDFYSQYVQGAKLTGYLFLSVDPVDFLTLSENNSNWRSCHALDGDYRSGNLSYMVDKTTFIAYLAPNKLVHLKNLPSYLSCRDKKWRMLLHTNEFESIIYFNREYPFSNDHLVQTAFKMIKVLRREENWDYFQSGRGIKKIITGPNENVHELRYNYILGERDRLYDTRDVIDELDSLGFTDLCYSSTYTPRWALRADKFYDYSLVLYQTEDRREWDKAFHSIFDISIGEPCNCLKCGKEQITRSDSFLCDLCIAENDVDEDLFERCCYCGRRLFPMDKRYRTSNNELFCVACHEAGEEGELIEN